MSNYWHKMTSIDDTLVYVNKLGFGISRKYRYPGWIPEAQRRLVKVETSLASVFGYPFYVHYSRKNSRFFVRSVDGTIVQKGS